MSYSRVLDVSGCIQVSDYNPSVSFFEPAVAMQSLPKALLDMGNTLTVLIRDEETSIEYRFDTFISRSYGMIGDRVKFGSKSIQVDKMAIYVGVKFIPDDLSGMTDKSLD
jgi:hypothetical protein